MATIDEESASKFINALIKSVQTLCHGYLDFDTGIEIIGHINLSVDKIGSLDYILKEKVCKNNENSTLFISNSFHAQPKPEQPAKGKNSQQETVVQRRPSSENESGRVSSAISSISTALTGAKDSSTSSAGSRPQQNTAKRKAHDDSSGHRPAKSVSHEPRHFRSRSRSSSPVDSKPDISAGFDSSNRNSSVDGSATMLPQTASVTSDSQSELDVNLEGSVLERVDDRSNSDLPERDDDDLDLEVTFIKEEFVEGERSACEFQGSSGSQQYGRTHQRASSDSMGEPPLFPVALHSNASATYVPGQDIGGLAQQYVGAMGGTSQPQPGPSGMRGLQGGPSFMDMLSQSGPRGSTGFTSSLSLGSSIALGDGSSTPNDATSSLIGKGLQKVRHRMYRRIDPEQLINNCLNRLSDQGLSSDSIREALEREKRRVMKRMYRATLPESKKSEIRLKDAERKRMRRAAFIGSARSSVSQVGDPFSLLLPDSLQSTQDANLTTSSSQQPETSERHIQN